MTAVTVGSSDLFGEFCPSVPLAFIAPYTATVVLGPIALSVLEFIRGAARAEGGVGGPAVGPPRESPWFAWATSGVAGLSKVGLVQVRHRGSQIDLGRPSRCPSD